MEKSKFQQTIKVLAILAIVVSVSLVTSVVLADLPDSDANTELNQRGSENLVASFHGDSDLQMERINVYYNES